MFVEKIKLSAFHWSARKGNECGGATATLYENSISSRGRGTEVEALLRGWEVKHSFLIKEKKSGKIKEFNWIFTRQSLCNFPSLFTFSRTRFNKWFFVSWLSPVPLCWQTTRLGNIRELRNVIRKREDKLKICVKIVNFGDVTSSCACKQDNFKMKSDRGDLHGFHVNSLFGATSCAWNNF